jgi:hypothetical protein
MPDGNNASVIGWFAKTAFVVLVSAKTASVNTRENLTNRQVAGKRRDNTAVDLPTGTCILVLRQ